MRVYELYYTGEFKRDAKKLGGPMQARLKKALEKIAQNPTRFKHLEHNDRFRVRFDVYRILYRVTGNRLEFIRVGKRDSVYEE